MDELKIPVYTCHTSGHGSRDCIRQVIDITKPEVVIPIHTEVPEAIKELTDKAVVLQDRRNIPSKGVNKEIWRNTK